MKHIRVISLILVSVLMLSGTACATSDYTRAVSEWNTELESYELAPSVGLTNDLDPEIVALSGEIVGAETDPEAQVKLIYQWVTTHIYYDFDAFTQNTDTFHTPLEVLENRRGECDGFALLFQALVQAQNIPCILCKGYALGQGTTGIWTNENYMIHEVNHNWNEVYLNGEWQLMDTTWDVNNAYTAGSFIDGTPSERWYQFTKVKLDATRRIDVRGPIYYDEETDSFLNTAETDTKSDSLSDFETMISSGQLSSRMSGTDYMLLLLTMHAVLHFPGI